MNNVKKVLPGCLMALGLLSTTALADWQVDSSQSQVFFISTKNLNVSEILSFKQITGKLTDDGKFSADIAVSSVETGIDIRNQRMRDMLFKADMFPNVTISATLPKAIMELAKGASLRTELPATLSLMGLSKDLSLDLIVNKTNDGKYLVTSAKPVLLVAGDLGLKEGVEALQKVAGLSSIGLTVPVTFNLVLN